MTEQPGAPRRGDETSGGEVAPEVVNREQDDESEQAQTVADEVLGRGRSGPGLSDSEKAGGGLDDLDTPDVVDHMNQMASSGRIEMGAYRGERSDDDEDELGEQGIDDDSPRLTG